jgi:SAM-dependent methyltransferase
MGLYSDWVFPWITEQESKDTDLHPIRRSVLRDVRGRVLEVGFGTGANLPFYPPEVDHLTVVEPSTGMTRRAARHVAAWNGEIETRPLAGERLPFDDGSFDSVVIAFVLCSAKDPPAVLGEARRVLRPGGCLHYLEHVISTDPRVRTWQRRLNGIHAALGCGCELTRDTEPLIPRAGFSFERIERGDLHSRGLFRKLYPGVWGKAVRTA